MAVMIENKNEFILEASKLAMHALLSTASLRNRDPQGIADLSRKYAIALWLAMRLEAK